MSRIPLTIAGAEKLKAELRRLKTVDRPAAIVAIAEARSHGDLSENAEYDAAKERQGFLEVRIRDIETMLAQAQIVDPAQIDADGRVVFGATVDLEDHESGDRVCYQIVGDDEADIKAGKISVNSPIARALIGKHAGDTAEVQAPGGRARIRGAGRPLRLNAAGSRRAPVPPTTCCVRRPAARRRRRSRRRWPRAGC